MLYSELTAKLDEAFAKWSKGSFERINGVPVWQVDVSTPHPTQPDVERFVIVGLELSDAGGLTGSQSTEVRTYILHDTTAPAGEGWSFERDIPAADGDWLIRMREWCEDYGARSWVRVLRYNGANKRNRIASITVVADVSGGVATLEHRLVVPAGPSFSSVTTTNPETLE